MHRVSLPCALFLIVLNIATAEAQRRSQNERRGYGTAIGVGFGIDKVNFDDRTRSQGVTYFTGNVRLNFWDNDDADTRGRLKGYLEAELGYWNDDDLVPFERDLLVGVNAIANVHAGTVDVFFGGGFGYHLFGSSVAGVDDGATDDAAVGANMQFGVDLNFTDSVAFFAIGRYDILTGDVYDFQTKILGGLRFKFF